MDLDIMTEFVYMCKELEIEPTFEKLKEFAELVEKFRK